MSLRLALYGVLFLSIIGGVFLIGYNAGSNKQKVIIQERIIHAGERHAGIEKRQNEIITNRHNYNIIKRLQSGKF